MQKPSPLLRENFRGSDRTLMSSSLGSNNSSRSNVNTAASSSFYTNSNADLHDCVPIESDEDIDDDDDDDGLTLEDRQNGDEGVDDGMDDNDDGRNRRKRSEELESDKGLWDRKIHYILLSFGAVFGLRNIMEFPALAMKHGGGAFLFVYVILTYFVGLPIVYLEVSLGQYARGGVVTAWRIMPLARGIAVNSLLLSLAVCSYSLTPAAWALYYLYSAMADWLPLEHVPPTLNSTNPDVEEFATDLPLTNVSSFFTRPSYNISHFHFYTVILEVTDSISSMGHVVSRVLVCVIILWLIVFTLSALGPQNLAKVSFCFTAVPSVLMLAVLFIVACTLPGSVQGIQAFLNPRWEHLSSFQPWLDALDLVLSGLACGSGILITLSGHCKFHGNTFRNAMSITSLSLVVTLMSGCLMLALLGVEAYRARVGVDQITGLGDYDFGFVLFPAASTQLPKPALWSGIFFVSLALFAFIQGAVAVQHMHQGALDFLRLRDGPRRVRLGVLGAIVLASLCLNILTTAQNGLHLMRLLQMSVTRLTTPLLSVAQCLVVGWGYGARRFAGRVLEMTGRNKSLVWKWLWRWGCPLFLTLMIVTSFLTSNLLQSLPAEDMHKKWLHGIGWALNPIILLPGLAMALVSYFRLRGSFKQRAKQLRSTPSDWGPGHPEHEPQADLPDYVICHPDPFRPANALAMLTANLYLPNIINFASGQSANSTDPEMVPPSYLSAAANPCSDDDGSSASLASDSSSSSHDGPRTPKSGLCGRCHASVLCLSRVIGLGNIVRFPYLAYKHGGGAFLIAYFLILGLLGLPLVILETAIGQYSSLGPIRVWRAVPIFKGVGYSMVAISTVTSIYYGVMCSWAMLYLVTSMTSVTPWEHCNNGWNTNSCITIESSRSLCQSLTNESSPALQSNTSRLASASEGTEDRSGSGLEGVVCDGGLCNCTGTMVDGVANALRSSVSEYFYRLVVERSEDWTEPRDLSWQLSLCLLTAWTMVTLALIKGMKPGERTTYFMLGLTTVTLLVLFVRASSLQGGHDGLSFLFTPQWSFLTRGQLWRDAATQVFFSLSLGSGTLVAIGTYNKFNNNLFTEAALICGLDSLVSVLSSLVVFAVLGSFGYHTGQAIDQVAMPDLGVSFVALSHATLHLPGHLFWSALTFLTLVICGVFTCTSMAATAVTSLVEVFTGQLKKQRVWLVLGLCAAAALLGLTLMVQSGFNVIDVLDRYLSGLPQLFTSALVVSAFAWVYGVNRFSGDVSRMINSQVSWWWRVLWGCVCPCLLLILIIVSLASLLSGAGEPSTDSPWFTRLIGMFPLLTLLIPVVVCACHEVSQARSKILLEGSVIYGIIPHYQKIRRACQTRREWGATEHRCSSHVEYFPTVHTHMGIDISLDGLNTVTDRVEFSTVGVRVPSLSQTSLLPVSPGMRKASKGSKGGKVRDMRHTAILNHAYSNPQCNLSSGSLEKPEKKKRPAMPAEISKTDDVIFVRRKRKKVPTCDASTQTDRRWHEPTLFRQRSQPCVRVSQLLPSHQRRITRSLSWHQLGQPAVLPVDDGLLAAGSRNGSETSKGAFSKTIGRMKSNNNNNNSSSSISNSDNNISCHDDNTNSSNICSKIPAEKQTPNVSTSGNVKRGKLRGTGTGTAGKRKVRDVVGGNVSVNLPSNTDPVMKNTLLKTAVNKLNRSVSCDDSNGRHGNSGTTSKTCSPKLEKMRGSTRGTGVEKRRRCGQSVAPNLNMLVRQSSLPQGQLHTSGAAAVDPSKQDHENCPSLERPPKLAYSTEGFRLSNVATGSAASQKVLGMKRNCSSMDPGKLPSRKCADTVVRLSGSKHSIPEVCALSHAQADANGVVTHSQKGAASFPGSFGVETLVASVKSKGSNSPRLNKIYFTECGAKPLKSSMKRSETMAGAGKVTTPVKYSMRPVVSQPSIGGAYGRQVSMNGIKTTSSTPPYLKQKPRSKSVDDYTNTEDRRSEHHRSNGSLPPCSSAQSDTFPLRDSVSITSENDTPVFTADTNKVTLAAGFRQSPDSCDSSGAVRRNPFPALPLLPPKERSPYHTDVMREASSRHDPERACSRGTDTCEEPMFPERNSAVGKILSEDISTPNFASGARCSDEDCVILEETEVDLQLDQQEQERLVSTSSLFSSSLSLPSPSSSLLLQPDTVDLESSKL